jgi:hypothetical protein
MTDKPKEVPKKNRNTLMIDDKNIRQEIPWSAKTQHNRFIKVP